MDWIALRTATMCFLFAALISVLQVCSIYSFKCGWHWDVLTAFHYFKLSLKNKNNDFGVCTQGLCV